MTRVGTLRPTPTETVLAAVLLFLALVEALFSDEQPAPTIVRVVAAVVPAVAVAFSKAWPEGAAAVGVCVLMLDSLQPSPSGTLGAGFAWLAIAFGVAAWARQPWPWLMALVLAGTLRGVRTVDSEVTNVVIDWVFIGFTIWVGRIVHRRHTQAEALAGQLRLAESEREDRTREAVARERAVIARELHDIVAHSVSLMVVQAGTARPLAQQVDDELAGVLDTIEHAGREALTELRRLLHVLRAPDEADLQPIPDLSRLDDLIAGVRRAGVDVQATVAVPVTVPPGVALCGYRAVQEGLTNAMRHAPGSRIEVEVEAEAGTRMLLVRVRDVGGPGTATGAQLGTGAGLAGLRERVLLCGGHMTAHADGPGFLLAVALPLSDDAVPFQAPALRVDPERS